MKNIETLKGKVKTLGVIEKELSKRLEIMRRSNINVKIAVVNKDTDSLGTIADVYGKSIEENLKMLSTMEKILGDICEILKEE